MDLEVNGLNSLIDFSSENDNLIVNSSSPLPSWGLEEYPSSGSCSFYFILFSIFFCNFYFLILYLVLKLWNKKSWSIFLTRSEKNGIFLHPFGCLMCFAWKD